MGTNIQSSSTQLTATLDIVVNTAHSVETDRFVAFMEEGEFSTEMQSQAQTYGLVVSVESVTYDASMGPEMVTAADAAQRGGGLIIIIIAGAGGLVFLIVTLCLCKKICGGRCSKSSTYSTVGEDEYGENAGLSGGDIELDEAPGWGGDDDGFEN